jgi:hypothetical protein
MKPVRGDRLMRAGSVVFATGMVFTLIAILPLITPLELPSIWWGLSMLTGFGLGMILLGLRRSSKTRSSL